MRLIFDIEANNLYWGVDKVWCTVTKDIDTNDISTFNPDGIDDSLNHLHNSTMLVGHNIIGYDIPVLKKLHGWSPKNDTKIVDTYVLSRLLNPERKGHSLEWWGNQSGKKKVVHEDWSQFSPEMMNRCETDVEINYSVYNYLLKEIKESPSGISWALPIRIEHEVQRIITQQEINGWLFDINQAYSNIKFLEEERDKIYKEIRPKLKPEVIHKWTEVKKPWTKAGGLVSRVIKHFGDSDTPLINLIAGQHSLVEFIEPDIGKRGKFMRQLSFLGWKPTEYTEKGNPKLTEDSMEFLGGLGKRIAKWYIYSHRQSQIEGFIRNVRDDGRIPAIANTCGTPTGRMRHSIVVNVPKAAKHVVFGKEMRSLFTVPDDKVLIGHDASGLEARMMAHYLNDDEMTHEIIHGDFHTKIWEPIKGWVDSRDNAKNVEYAFIYGAGDEKLGKMADRNNKSHKKAGKMIRAAILESIPALKELTDNVKKQAKRGYLVGLDGRKLIVRSEHSALNTLFQGAGAIVMKMSMIYLDRWVNEYNLDVKKVVDQHDEGQAEVLDDVETIDLYCYFAVNSIIKAGQFFNLNCPLDAEAKVGRNWSETH